MRRIILTFALLLIVGWVEAQTRTTTVLFPQARRSGTQVSGSVVTRADSADFDVMMVLDPGDVTDSSNQVVLTLEGSFDGGQSWQRLASGVWDGGKLDREGNPLQPSIGYASNTKPDRVRLTVDLKRSQICRADLSEGAKGTRALASH